MRRMLGSYTPTCCFHASTAAIVSVSAARPALIAAATFACSSGPRLRSDSSFKNNSTPEGPATATAARISAISFANVSKFAILFHLSQLIIGQNDRSQVDDSLQVLRKHLLALWIFHPESARLNQRRPLIFESTSVNTNSRSC